MIQIDPTRLAGTHRETYLAATPWPHLLLDDLIDPKTIAAAEAQELKPGLDLHPEKSWRQIKAGSPTVNGPAAQSILDFLCAPRFLAFLEGLTGVPELRPDPTFYWGGLQVSPPGAFQALHRDFRVHPVTGLYHRVNVLVYLNSDWYSEYGGDLELWGPDRTACEKRISPLAGRVVIFETTPTSFHGVPEPIRCPLGRARLSLSSYYYTDTPGRNDRRMPYLARPKRPQDPWYMGLAAFGDGLTTIRRFVRNKLL
jgi:2OG-Fe(II) oxygenase superfamily